MVELPPTGWALLAVEQEQAGQEKSGCVGILSWLVFQFFDMRHELVLVIHARKVKLISSFFIVGAWILVAI